MAQLTPPHHSGSASLDEHGRRGRDGGRVLVLNASYEPINVCTVRRAAVLILKNRAEVLERGDWALHSENLTLARPVVIRLLTYVRMDEFDYAGAAALATVILAFALSFLLGMNFLQTRLHRRIHG